MKGDRYLTGDTYGDGNGVRLEDTAVDITAR